MSPINPEIQFAIISDVLDNLGKSEAIERICLCLEAGGGRFRARWASAVDDLPGGYSETRHSVSAELSFSQRPGEMPSMEIVSTCGTSPDEIIRGDFLGVEQGLMPRGQPPVRRIVSIDPETTILVGEPTLVSGVISREPDYFVEAANQWILEMNFLDYEIPFEMRLGDDGKSLVRVESTKFVPADPHRSRGLRPAISRIRRRLGLPHDRWDAEKFFLDAYPAADRD